MDQSTSTVLSRRLSQRSSTIGESTTLAIASEARRMQAEGISVISFSMGEPDFPTPRSIKDAAIEAIEKNFTRYTQPEGIPELRKAVATKFTRDNDIPTEPAEVLVSVGGKHSLFNALMAIVDEGDEVLIQSPYWTSYPELVKLAGGTPVIIETRSHEGYRMTAEQLRGALTPRSRAIILNSPSNPTGVVYTREELMEFGRILAEAGIYVISDELYEKILYDGNEHFSIGSMPQLRDLAITINGVSKAYSMTGWRIGYMRGPLDVIKAAARIQGQAVSSPASISQMAALQAMTGVDSELGEMLAAFARRRELISGLMSEIPGLRFPIPSGAFYLFIDFSEYFCQRAPTDVDLARYLLQEHHVATVPGSAFGDSRAIRISYATSDDDLREGAARIKRGLEELRGSR